MVRTVVSVICLGTLEFSFSVKSKAQQRFFLLWNSQKMQTLTNKNRKNSIFWLVSLALHLYQSFNPCFDQSLITFWKVQIVEKLYQLLNSKQGCQNPNLKYWIELLLVGNTDLSLVLVPLTLLLPMFGSTLVPKRVSSCPEAFEALG